MSGLVRPSIFGSHICAEKCEGLGHIYIGEWMAQIFGCGRVVLKVRGRSIWELLGFGSHVK
jgi:hypothetical protein